MGGMILAWLRPMKQSMARQDGIVLLLVLSTIRIVRCNHVANCVENMLELGYFIQDNLSFNRM